MYKCSFIRTRSQNLLLGYWHEFIYNRWMEMREWQIYKDDNHCLLFGPLHFAMKDKFSNRVFPRSPYSWKFRAWYRREAKAARSIIGEWEKRASHPPRHLRRRRTAKLVLG